MIGMQGELHALLAHCLRHAASCRVPLRSACAGHVRAAADLGAIQTLLLTDALFRTNDVAARRGWVALVDSVRGGGGDVHIFSSAHVSGEQLGQISGAAAILRFPLPELEDQEL